MTPTTTPRVQVAWRRYSRIYGAGVLSLLTVTTTTAAVDYKGLQFGIATADDVRIELLKMPGFTDWRCDAAIELGGDGNCLANASTYANIPIRSGLFRFIDGRLAGVTLTFPSAGYATIAGALRTKFGKPDRQTKSNVKNLAGATFPTESLILRNKRIDGRVVVQERASSMDEGVVHLGPYRSLQRPTAPLKPDI
jgi:hypothetical protein